MSIQTVAEIRTSINPTHGSKLIESHLFGRSVVQNTFQNYFENSKGNSVKKVFSNYKMK
jgi:hypothetical protein